MTPMSLLCDPTLRPIIAHRGASARAPENTLPAFALALEEGAEAIELDVHVSADDVPVVIHDPTLDRTTDRTRRRLVQRLAAMGPRILERPEAETSLRELRRLGHDLEHYRQRVHDLVYDAVALELGGSE